MEIANLLILFNTHGSSDVREETLTDSSGDTGGTRIEQLVAYVVSNYKLVSCFDDIKPLLEQLSLDDAKMFLQHMSEEGEKVNRKNSGDRYYHLLILSPGN
jgi:hypothetical protein